MKFSDINGKKVVDKSSGEYLGILTYMHMNISEYKAMYLGAKMDEHIAIYSFENSIIGDAVFVENSHLNFEGSPLFIGEEVYDINANLIGVISDFFITNYKITTLFINGEKIPCSNVITFGKDCLIIKSRTRLSKLIKSEIKSKNVEGVIQQNNTKLDNILTAEKATKIDNILEKKDGKIIEKASLNNSDIIRNREIEYIAVKESENIVETNFVKEQESSNAPAYSETPILYSYKKEMPIIINDYNFLIGKRLIRDVYDLTNSFVAKKGSYINSTIIWNAKKYGKIVDLALSSV